jgi:pimeloyl-ACP methyl ester carboxylesterase
MATYVLVHGAWHYGELWHETAEALRAKGHVVHHPTIGGNEADADLRTNHAQACAPVIDYIVTHDLRDIVLLGHSYGGTVISKVAEATAERVKRMIYWNAFVVQDGNCLLDECPPPLAQALVALAEERGDGGCVLPFPVWRELFIQDASLEMAEKAYSLLRPHPIATFTDKLDLSKFYSLEIPKSYINCTEDMTLTQLPEFGWHPRMSHRLGVFRLVQMPGSHEVMFTDPEGLADAIERAGRD